MQLLKNKMFYISLAILVVLAIFDYLLAFEAVKSATNQFWLMLQIVPPIFVLIGLLDVWVPRETMMKYMGDESGIKGIIIAFIIGTFAAGPLVGAFPLAMIMLKKGARYGNVLFFMMMWASAKLPIIFFQISTMGLKFTLVSNAVLIIIFLIGSYFIEKTFKSEVDKATEKSMNY